MGLCERRAGTFPSDTPPHRDTGWTKCVVRVIMLPMPDAGRIPGPEVIPNVVTVRMIWALANGRTAYNVCHGTVAGGFSATSTVAEAIFAAMKASAAWTAWKARLNTGVSFAGIDLRDIRAANLPVVQSTGGAVTGTGAGGALPPGDALCVTLRTAGAGRAFRGRVYLPGLDNTALAAAGTAAAGTVTDATAFVTELQTAMTASSLTLAIAQPARAEYTGHGGRVIPARAASSAAVTSIVTRNAVIDHQRRRAGKS